MAQEAFTLQQVSHIHEFAVAELAVARQDRIDPETSVTHPDHWLAEVPGNVAADIAQDNPGNAQAIVRYWLDRTAPDGRAPHMIIDEGSSWLRLQAVDRVQMTSVLPDGTHISPFSGPPVLSSSALAIAEALPEAERKAWVDEVMPKLIGIKQHQYRERDVFGDGLPIQIHPDEVLLRNGRVSEAVLAGLPDSKLIEFERWARNSSSLQALARGYRRWQGDDSRRDRNGGTAAESTYDSADMMDLSVAARLYTLWSTVQKNAHSAKSLMSSIGKDGRPDGYLVQDVALTGMLLADNRALVQLAALQGSELPADIKQNMALTEQGLHLHWDEETGKFAARVPASEKLLLSETGDLERALMLLGRSSLREVQVDQTIKAALGREQGYPILTVPTAAVSNAEGANKVDRGGFSPSLNLALYNALMHYDHPEAELLQRRIGNSIIQASIAAGHFPRQSNSITRRPIGQSRWRPSAAAALVVTRDLLS